MAAAFKGPAQQPDIRLPTDYISITTVREALHVGAALRRPLCSCKASVANTNCAGEVAPSNNRRSPSLKFI